MMSDYVTGGVWKPVDVPQVLLDGWAIVQIGDDFHFAGYSQEYREARVSSPMKRICVNEKGQIQAVSRSGRTYLLNERSGMGSDATYLLAQAFRLWGVEDRESVKYYYRIEDLPETADLVGNSDVASSRSDS